MTPFAEDPRQLERCIDACLRCYRLCTQMLSLHCLQIGGEHAQPGHVRLMLECAETCRACAHQMLIGSPRLAALCRPCADLCHACADSCAMLDGMQDCVAACRECAEACEGMATVRP